MKSGMFFATVAASALMLSGCGTGSEDQSGDTISEAESQSATEDAEPTPSKPPLPKFAYSCNNPDSGEEISQVVSEPASGKIYIHNTVDYVNENQYSQVADDYSLHDGVLSFFANYAKEDHPNKIEFALKTGAWSEENGYNPEGRKEAEACEAREREERADCATAGNIDACIQARYPGLKGMCYSGANLSTHIDRSCTPLSDYDTALIAAKNAWSNSVTYWKSHK